MAGSTAKECGVCSEVFSETSHCPKILPCSHCVCAPCIDRLISKDLKFCPFCRRKFDTATSRDLGTNFNLLDILKYVSELERSTSAELERSTSAELERSTLARTSTTTPTSEIQKLREEIISNFKRAASHLSHAMRGNASLRDASLLADERLDTLLDTLRGVRAENRKLTVFLDEENVGMQTKAKNLAEREEFFRRLVGKLQGGKTVSSPRCPSVEMVKNLNTATKGLVEDVKDLLSEWEKRRLSAEKDIERRNTMIDVIEEILKSSN